jgi:hypothetical protein
MKKINNYIKYLLTLILFGSTKVFAQTTENLRQISSQTNQELSNFLPSNSSFVNSISFSEIMKQNIDKLGYYFINYAIPFLFVFGILTYLTYESKKEINRPLLLIYFIIAFLVTIYFHAVIIILAIVFTFVLIFIGIHKIFHGITGSIIGSIIVILLAYIVLTNSSSIMEFLPSSAFYILLFILFIFIFIYGYKLSQSIDINKLKKLMSHIRKPEDVRNFENQVNMYITNFKNRVGSLEQTLIDIQTKLNEFNNFLNQKQSPQQLKKQIQQILNRLQQQQILPQLLQNHIQILIETPLQKISQKQIEQIISQIIQIKQQSPRQHQQYIGQLINLLNQLKQQKQLLKQLKGLKKEIKRLINDYNKQYKDFNDDYNNIINFINNVIRNFQQNYNNLGIIRFLTNKKNELESIKQNINNKQILILNNPIAQKLIKNYILK